MKKMILKRVAIHCFSLAILMTGLAALATAQNDKSGNAKTTFRSVVTLPVFAVVPSAGSTVSTNNDGVFFTFHTQGLPPGMVATMWLGVFNNPEFCAAPICTPNDFMNPLVKASLLASGGKIIGLDGAATYGAYRDVGDTTGADFGPGLLYPKKAQIQLVVRTHGAPSPDPVILNEQLTTFNGGCPPELCQNVQISVHR